jgi:hypothetical protein
MRSPITLTLALIGGLAMPLVATTFQDTKVPTVEEPETGIEFPVTLTVLPKTEKREAVKHQLNGLGVREKTWLKVDVYALGFYMDDLKGLAALKKPAGDLSVSKLQDSKDFRKALLGDTFGKTMRLVMARDVDADDMSEAFNDALWPRMEERTKKDEERKAAEAAMAKFKGFFEKEAEEDQVLDFTWMPGGLMYAVVDGKRHPVVKSEPLCWALFDIFVGDDPITEDGKEDIFKELHKKLHPKK